MATESEIDARLLALQATGRSLGSIIEILKLWARKDPIRQLRIIVGSTELSVDPSEVDAEALERALDLLSKDLVAPPDYSESRSLPSTWAEESATIAYDATDSEHTELLEVMQPFIQAEISEQDFLPSMVLENG